MAAAAYVVTLVCALGSPRGPRKMIAMTASDVAAAFWLFPDGTSANVLHGTKNVYIIDAILSAAGTDTAASEMFIGGVSNGVRLRNATSIATTINRPFQSAPMLVPAGMALSVVQRAS